MTAFQRLLSYFKPYKSKIAFGIACVFMTNLVKLTQPIVVRRAVDDLTSETTHRTLLYYGLTTVLISVIQGVFLFTQRRVLINMSRDIEYDLRNGFYAHLQKLSFEFYQQNRTGDLMARATNDLGAVRMIVGPALMYSVNTIFSFVLILPIMALISSQLTMLSVVSIPLVAFATHYFGKRIHERFQDVQEYFGTVSNRAQESLAGVRVIRAYAQEEAEKKSFREVNREYVRRNVGLIKLSSIFHPLLQLCIGFGFIAVLAFGGRLVINGHISSVGQFIQFNLYLGYLIWPMIALGWVVNIFQRGMASMNRMHAIMNTEPAIRDLDEEKSGKTAADISEIRGEIDFRHLTFTYKGAAEPALDNLTLHIPAGQTVAFAGAVGSGKSTLMNLVPRLLDAEPGMVLIDGRPIQEIPL